jgi:hypothetical protein
MTRIDDAILVGSNSILVQGVQKAHLFLHSLLVEATVIAHLVDEFGVVKNYFTILGNDAHNRPPALGSASSRTDEHRCLRFPLCSP